MKSIHTNRQQPSTKRVRQTRSSRPMFCARLSVLILAISASACTNDEEKATRAIEQAVKSCREAPADEAFYGVERFDGEQDEILQAACAQEIADFKIFNGLTASASTGPVVWNAQRSQETGGWTVASVEWPDIERARRALDESDPTEEQLTYASKHLQSAQKAVPESGWIRLARLDALLKLRAKTRSPDTPNPTTIGADAQKQLDETMAWAKTKNDLDVQVEAQYKVVEHLENYLTRVEGVLQADGSSDEWLIKSAEVAEKEGNTEKAEEYRAELEQVQQKRAKSQEIFTQREAKLRKALCAQVTSLSPSGVQNTSLQQRVNAKKEAIDCMKRAEAPVAADTE